MNTIALTFTLPHIISAALVLILSISAMSGVASQVVLHPVTSQSLKLLGTTTGRDKTYRAVQYLARFLAWFLLTRGYKDQSVRWNALKSHLALGRKMMRLGKPLENLQAALRAIQSYGKGETGEQITTIARQLSYFGYLSYDTLVWANAIKFITLKPETAQKVNKTANRFWLAGILLNITHGLLKAGRLANEAKKLRSGPAWSEKDVGAEADLELKYRSLEVARAATRHQFVIDVLDVWLPATSLGLVNINEGVLGIFGLVTSIMGFRSQWIAVNGKK